MSKFKAGDRVRCISASRFGYAGIVGHIYVVARPIAGNCVDLENPGERGRHLGCDADRFELVKEPAAPKSLRDLKRGDRVTLEFTVSEIIGDLIRAQKSDGTAALGLRMDAGDGVRFVSAERPPEPLKVGDRVTWGSGSYTAEIKHIDGDDAFIKGGTYQRAIAVKLSNLRRAT